MKKIVVLGSTGSIGKSTLSVVNHHPDRFQIVGLAAGSNVDEMVRQAKAVRPQIISMADRERRMKFVSGLERESRLFMVMKGCWKWLQWQRRILSSLPLWVAVAYILLWQPFEQEKQSGWLIKKHW